MQSNLEIRPRCIIYRRSVHPGHEQPRSTAGPRASPPGTGCAWERSCGTGRIPAAGREQGTGCRQARIHTPRTSRRFQLWQEHEGGGRRGSSPPPLLLLPRLDPSPGTPQQQGLGAAGRRGKQIGEGWGINSPWWCCCPSPARGGCRNGLVTGLLAPSRVPRPR